MNSQVSNVTIGGVGGGTSEGWRLAFVSTHTGGGAGARKGPGSVTGDLNVPV